MIHKYTMHNTNIVMDISSGAVHVFDATAFEVVDLYKTKTKEQIIEALSQKYAGQAILDAYDEIAQLESEGLLFSEDVYSEAIKTWERKPVVKALCLHICHDCNLRCKYCFASTGSFGGHRTMMDVETGKKAIDFLIEKSAGRRNLEVDFFGGEPLMNFNVVKQIVEYARIKEKETDKNFRFTITTNAILLNEDNKEFINKHMHNVVLSIDGRKETNDRMRPRMDGSGTYDSILPKIKDLAASRNQDNYYVRGTFTRENLDFSEDVLHLADEGFKQISIEPVVAAKDSGYDIREQDLDKLFSEYELLADEYIKRGKNDEGFNFFHFMIDLKQGPCVIKRLGGCGSGHEYLAVTPEGDLYPCHQFVGDERFKMGNIHLGVFNTDSQQDFQKSNVYSKKDCSECWAKFYCSGGCAANAYQFNNDINIPYRIGCELEKKRVECAIWIKTQE
jgi:uncharacterized protein